MSKFVASGAETIEGYEVSPSGIISPLTTKGDLFTYSTENARLAVGTDGQIVSADAAEPTGLKWIDPPSGGSGSIGSGAYASRPAAGNVGNLYLPTDGYTIQRDDGAAWQPFGPIHPLTEPPTSGWTLDDQHTVSVTQAKGAIELVTTTLFLTRLSVYRRAAPTPPYTITACLLYNFITKGGVSGSGYVEMGMAFRQSSDGKLVTLVMGDQANGARSLSVNKWNTNISFNASYVSDRWNQNPIWFQISDDATNRICRVSMDGQNFDPYHSIGRTDFMTADEVGLVMRAQTTTGSIARITLLSWKVT